MKAWWLLPALSVACAPVVRTDPLSPAHAKQSSDRATWQARADFTAAVEAADAGRVAGLFAPDAFLITPGGDSIRGRDAVARFLAHLGHDAYPVAVSFGREGSLQTCVGAAYEYLAYNARLTRVDGTQSVSGNVSVFWKQDSTGALKVAWVAVSQGDRRRGLTRQECPSVDAARWRAWRWAVSMSAGACSCKVRAPGFLPDSKLAPVVPYNLVTVQRHLRPHVVAGIATGHIATGSTTGTRTYPNRDYGLTRIGHSAQFLAGLVAYEHRGIQVAAGPIVQLAHWRLRDSLVPFSTGGLPSFHDTTWSALPIGIVGDVRYSMFVGSRTFMTFHVQTRRFPDARIPPATPRLSAALDQSTSLFSIDFGVIF
ncbi:MAG: YybH family protein [Gemmatimonadales bacterium]